MNVKPATTHPLATQEIDGMIDMISTLIEKGYAYNVNGTVYFRTRRFEEYGKLSHKISMICDPETVPFWYPVKIRRKIRLISSSGNRKKRESPPGPHPGATDVRAGILSAP